MLSNYDPQEREWLMHGFTNGFHLGLDIPFQEIAQAQHDSQSYRQPTLRCQDIISEKLT